ncbi:MAG: PAS domain S-box protein [Candidatus Bathyarchaeia archaeon]|jgi:PAS domain S-box-containing protein
MSGAKGLQDSNSKVMETTFQPVFIVGTSEKKDSLRILHVDDDQGFLEVSKQILTIENNFEIDTASSVDAAFKKMESQTYDAVISDYEMPQKNGLDFLKELRQQQSDIPFILFTGKGREEVVVKALNLGADSYINKNGSPETVYCELADAINKTVERKKSRNLLATSESKYRTLVEKSLQGIMIAQGDPPRVAFANASIGKILGYSLEEFTSLSPAKVAALIYYEDRTIFFNRFKNRLEGKQADKSYEFRAVRKDGSIVWMEAFATFIEYEGQPAVQAMFLDINERKKAEETLKAAEREKREILDSIREFVAYFDMNQKIMWANKALCNWLNLPAEKVIGRTCLEITSQSKPCDHCPAVKTLKTGQSENAEVLLPNGKLLWMDAYPILDKMGQMQGVVEISTDVTEYQKTAKEIGSLNEKLDVLGKMTRHDIKNKLQVINNHIFLAERHGKNENTPERMALQAVKQASLQIEAILNFAKDYEMLGSEELKFINVGEIFSEADALFQGLKDVKVVNDCGGLSVLADSLLRELFYNLVDNSLKYGEKIAQIRCSFEEDGEQLRLIYEDDGVGIPLGMKEKLFTKGFGKGTGLGLYLIKNMMEVYAGLFKKMANQTKEPNSQ